jgi:small conductance mechanosensitive channel
MSRDFVGIVEEVTLRATKLRNSDGEVFTFSNRQIVKSNNLSKDWARAVIDIPIPVSEDPKRPQRGSAQCVQRRRHR